MVRIQAFLMVCVVAAFIGCNGAFAADGVPAPSVGLTVSILLAAAPSVSERKNGD